MPTIYPPHPKLKIPPLSLNSYESSGGWIAQRKFNGTNVVINISPCRKVTILNRHGENPKLFRLSEKDIEQILSLNLEKNKEYWLNGELLDHKTSSKEYKRKIVLFDVLQAGEYFIRSPNQTRRLQILSEICNNPSVLEPNKGIALKVSDNIWMAETWSHGFLDRFKEFLDLDEIEGLILRKYDSVLGNFGQKKHDVYWMVKCRKPHKGGTYDF